ncbi:MAG: PIG-L family deacetylase [Akkermansiaceae bacterium]|nr:PIG-L family deacetylase [Akkermansiaceae bacterium]
MIQLHQARAGLTIPDDALETEALARVTHLGIGAHQDDLEFMAFHGILECYQDDAKWFGGVTCTNGAGSARSGAYADYTDEDMQLVRRREQDKAAELGKYGAMFHLDHPSSSIKSPEDTTLKEDLLAILQATSPQVVYTHNPCDKHDTHIGVTVATLQALRELAADQRPKQVIGCEVWRDLDWLGDEEKVVMDVSGHDDFAAKLNACFDSQIAGGKRYDLATLGRRSANATFFDSHSTDDASQVIFGIDLTPLVMDDSLDIVDYVLGFVERFQEDVRSKLKNRLG